MSSMSSTKEKSSSSRSSKSKVRTSTTKLSELESQFVMRLPEPYATQVRESLANNSLKDRLKVEFETDVRHAAVQFDDTKLSSKLHDLPCIIESWKSFDKKSLWKTGNICQMLLVKDPEDPSLSSDESDSGAGLDYFRRQQAQAKRHQHPHGLTPPLKNVRRRRFRKTARKKYVDPPEVEAEVKRLLRSDVSAADVRFEILNDDNDKTQVEMDDGDLDKESDTEPSLGTVASGISSLEPFVVTNENSNLSIFSSEGEPSRREAGAPIDDILPDISSSEDDDEEDGAKPSPLSLALNSARSTTSDTAACTETRESRLNALRSRLDDLLEKRAEQETRIERATNPLLKQRFHSGLLELDEEEATVRREMDELG